MIKREVNLPKELIAEIASLVKSERYLALEDAFLNSDLPTLFLSQEEAEALITLAVIEKRKASLRYPYHDDEHPNYSEEHEEKFDDIQMGLYEKIIYYVETAFKKGEFDHLL